MQDGLPSLMHHAVQELQALAETVGVVSKGLSATAIAALPAHTYAAPRMVLRSCAAQAESCAVCCEDLQVCQVPASVSTV